MKSFKKIIFVLFVFFMILGLVFAEGDITLDFDENQILCMVIDGHDIEELKSGATVSEGTDLELSVKKLPYHKVVSEWIIGKKKVKVDNNTCIYRVLKKDLKASKKIKISYKTRKAKKFKIIFDDRKLEGRNDSGTYNSWLKNKSEVYERNNLSFIPKDIKPANIALCIVNKRWLEPTDNSLIYTVEPSDADSNNEIKLIYAERKKELVRIYFDESEIKCTSTRTNKAVKSGSKILEGVKLNFSTVSGKAVIWIYGNTTIMPRRKICSFIIHKSMIPKGTNAMIISYEY